MMLRKIYRKIFKAIINTIRITILRSVAVILRGFGITVSESLGIDKSVDTMAIDEYDHIEEID
jgi:hypothetical protein